MSGLLPPTGSGHLLGRVAGKVTGRIAETIPPDVILEYVDVDGLLDRIDINRLLDRVDVERLLGRIDVNRVLAQVDVNVVLRDVDVEALVRRSGVPEIVAESTSRMSSAALDVVRRQLVGFDALLGRVVNGLMSREMAPVDGKSMLDPSRKGTARLTVTGRYAGPVTRAAAFVLDVAVVVATYTLGYAGLNLLTTVILGMPLTTDHGEPVAGLVLVLWWFCYSFASLVVSGRTLGKATIGLRVVRSDGGTLRSGQAFLRVCALPVSVALLGLGLILIVLRRDHRALHDLIAGTAVVIDWGDRPAELPAPLSAFLSRRAAWLPEPRAAHRFTRAR
jgi:uncharacterized RDD family membrane protein YckC